MRCIVTGGAGFIGSHLVDKLLADGHEVKILDNLSTGKITNFKGVSLNNQTFRQYDVRQTGKFMDLSWFEGTDWMFHLAGKADIVPSIKEPRGYFSTNVTGTVHMLEIARKIGVKKFVYAASSSCYGDFQSSYPTFEDEKINPKYPYALTKWLGEECVKHWGTLYNIPWVSLRLFNVYGTRSRTTGAYGAVIGTFLKQKLEGEPFTVVGDGEQLRDFIFVSDVVDAFLRAGESDKTGIYNIGSGTPQSINRLVELLGGEITYIPERPGEPKITHAGIILARKYLEWAPSIPFESGIKTMLEHIEDWREAPLWTPVKIEEETKEWFKNLS